MKDNPLYKIMNSRSIATVGAGNNPTKMGTIQALSILKDGFKGKFFPIHPREKTVLGHKAYSSVFDLPEPPDMVMFVVPTDQVIDLFEDFGKIGTKRAVIISAGFKETGLEGRKMEERLNEIAEQYGMRFLGPNCMGILNSQASLNLTVAAHRDKPGMLGIASQSGTYITQTLAYLKKRGIRFSKAISVGNEANIDIVDALEYLGEDQDTKAIALYLEGIRDGRRFIEVAQRITLHKPVVAQYVGGSTAGARAGMSHTGSMAGPDILYDGILKQAGIIRVHSVEDIYGHGWALATQPPLKGKRVGVVTNSGGPGTAMSNTCDLGGLEVPCFSDQLRKEIEQHIHTHAASANPVDLTFHLDTQVLTNTIPEIIMKSNEVDGIVLHGAMGTGFLEEIYPHLKELIGDVTLEKFLEQSKRVDLTGSVSLPWKYNIPLTISSFFDQGDNYTAAYQNNNIPVFDAPEKAARAMISLLRYKEIREREKIVSPVIPAKSKKAEKIITDALKKGQKSLDEYQSKQLLSIYGIPITTEKMVNTEHEAVEAALSIGFPIALKGCSSEIMHKTEKGLICLNQNSRDDLRRSFNTIRKAAGDEIPIIVSKMVNGDRELLAGMTRFPGFGPCIVFGLGGIFTEALKETTFRVAPLSESEAKEMVFDIRAQKMLHQFRGMPAVDIAALSGILQKIGFIALLHPQIAEIDLNPIIISGSKPVAVDALIVFSP